MTWQQTIYRLVDEAGIPSDTESDPGQRICAAAGLFDSDELKVRAAEALIAAWHDDHPGGGGERLAS